MNTTRMSAAGGALPGNLSAPPSGLKTKQAMVLLGAGLGMGGGFAALYFSTLSLFLKPLAQQFGWGRGQTSAATALAMAGMAVGAVLVGRLIDRLGAAYVIACSAIGMAVLTGLMSILTGNAAFASVLCFCIGLVGAGTTPIGYLSVLPRWFDRRLGLALGAAMVGLGLGTVVFPMVAHQAIASFGWRVAYVLLAGVSLTVSVAAWLMIFYADRRAVGYTHPVAQSLAAEGFTLREAMATPRYWLLVAVLFAASAAGLGMAIHGAALLTDRGVSAQAAAQIAALSGLGVMLGRLFAGSLMDSWSAPPVGAGSFLLGALGVVLYGHGPVDSIPVLSVAGVLAGFAIGAEGDLMPYAVRRYFGPKAFGAIFGTLFGVYALGGLLGPVMFGMAFDRTGSYQGVLMVAAAACVFSAIGCLFLGRERFAHRVG